MNYPTAIPPQAKTITTYEGWELSYSVDSTSPFAINAWNLTNPNPNNEPFWYQPHDLAGNDWPDEATAQTFADEWIQNNFINPPAPPVVTENVEPKIDNLESARALLEQAGYTVSPPAQ
jgi:hypothetical protein